MRTSGLHDKNNCRIYASLHNDSDQPDTEILQQPEVVELKMFAEIKHWMEVSAQNIAELFSIVPELQWRITMQPAEYDGKTNRSARTASIVYVLEGVVTTRTSWQSGVHK